MQGRRLEADSRVAAVFGALPAHLRAQLAMLVVVLLAFRGAQVADPRAQLQRLAQDLLVRSGAPESKPGRRLANVAAVEASTNALAHVHVLGRAGVGAGKAHL